VVDEVVIGLPIRSYYEQSSAIAALCELHGIVVRFLPGIFDLKLARSRAEEFEGDSLITLSTGPMDGWPRILLAGPFGIEQAHFPNLRISNHGRRRGEKAGGTRAS
jgi:hypothetical protein